MSRGYDVNGLIDENLKLMASGIIRQSHFEGRFYLSIEQGLTCIIQHNYNASASNDSDLYTIPLHRLIHRYYTTNTTPPSSLIRVSQNLTVASDCPETSRISVLSAELAVISQELACLALKP